MLKRKLFFFSAFCLNLLFSIPLSAALEKDMRPARSIHIGQKAIMHLKHKKSSAEIVIPKGTAASCYYAAEELKTFLEKKLEIKVPIVTQMTTGKISFILGVNNLSKAAGIDDKTLCRDAFIIRTFSNKIYIVGRDAANNNIKSALKQINGFQFNYECATLFGVYDFLERFADIRFYFDGEGTLVTPGDIKVPEINVYDRPDFTNRRYTDSGKWFNGTRGQFHKNIDHRRWRMETEYIPNCHGMSLLGYEQRFGKTHPEYFAMDSAGRRMNTRSKYPGQFCYKSNVWEELYKDAKSCLLNEPASKRGVLTGSGILGWDPSGHAPGKVFGMFQGDSFQPCHCPKCKVFLKDDKAFCDFFWGKVYDLAERLQKENIPGIVTAAAYGRPGHYIPSRKKPSNVELMICPQGPWAIYHNVHQSQKKRVIDWANYAGKRLYMWNYPGKYAGMMPGVPHITPRSIGKYYKEMAPWIVGTYLNSTSDYYYNSLLNIYVFAKVAWNNKTDVNALLDEYYQRMFGKAALSMKKIHERIEDIWLRQIKKEPINTSLGMLFRDATDHEVWTEIYSPAERQAMKKLFDKAEKECAKDSASLSRVKLIRKNTLDPLLENGAKYDIRSQCIEHFAVYTDRLAAKEKIAIDGKLNEPVWKRVKPLWLQEFVLPGQKVDFSVKPDVSKVYVTQDSTKLYIAFDFAEPDMKSTNAPKRKRGNRGIWNDNSIEIFLNPSCDRRNYFQFILTSSGSFDILKHDYISGFDQIKRDWTPKWEYKINCTDKGWSGEVSIPLSELGINSLNKMVANFTRHQAKGKFSMRYSWSPFLIAERTSPFQDIDHYGTIVFGADPRKNILKNGDFSDRLKSGIYYTGKWSSQPPADGEFAGDTRCFISGPQSLRLSGKSIFKGYFCAKQFLPQLKPNQKYRLSYFIKTAGIETGIRTGGGVVNIWDSNNRWFPRQGFTGDTGWTFQQFEFTTTADANAKKNSVINLFLLQSKGNVWFDDVCLEEIRQ